MKRQDIRALHAKTMEELDQIVVSLRKQIQATRLEKQASKQKNVHSITVIKDDLARILTVLTMKKEKDKQA
ncbi:50S ribosomal protein L29 [Candidatus Gottesmanbacteria bacterium]|nr:50S ribosomal protein L29 [Candidatus Gottesmanbacteria bacterium]